jgi:hypothetical protein
VRYLVVIVPEKATVYPEFLPPALRHGRLPSALDRLGAGPDVLDLRGPLGEAKSGGPVYFRTDCHWNPRGVHAAARSVVRALAGWFPDVRPEPEGGFRTTEAEFTSGDLARLLGLSGRLREPYEEFVRTKPGRARRTDEPVPMRPGLREPPSFLPEVWRCDDPRLPAVVMFHDSFAPALLPRLAEQCRKLTAAPTWGFDPDVVERARPDVVIQELAERALTWREPVEPAETGR